MPTYSAQENQLTLHTWERCQLEGGWRTNCPRSPLAQGSPSVAINDLHGWEPAGRDRQPEEGYEYGLAHTSTRPGGIRTAEWQYWSRWRRPIALPALRRPPLNLGSFA
jgi:hypothetical protein